MKRSLGRGAWIQPAPVWVIATYDEEGRTNAMTASWAGICCSEPPAVNVSVREATHTYSALRARRAFTIGVPSVEQAGIADYLGIVSGRDVDKLAAAGLTAVRAEHVDAPRISELPLCLECTVIHTHKIGLHTIFIGEILDVKADPEILNPQGRPGAQRLRPFVYAVGDGVYRPLGEPIGRAFQLGRSISGT